MDMNTNSIGIDETTVPVIESFTQIEIANKIGIYNNMNSWSFCYNENKVELK